MRARCDEAEDVLRRLLDPVNRGSPYPLYRQLRELDPVHQATAPGLNGAWVLTRHRDVERVMRNPRSYKNSRISALYGAGEDGPFSTMMRGLLPAAEPPDHARLRGLLSKAFTPRAIEGLTVHIGSVADRLIAAMQDRGPSTDLVADFAYQLPIIVICELLGIPTEDRHRFTGWSRDFSLAGDVSTVGPDIRRRGDQAAEEFDTYLRDLATERQRRPRNDLMSRMVPVAADGSGLSQDEIVGLAFTLLQAGHDTTSNLIAMGTLALLRHPDQLQRLRSDPGLVKGAVEELIRYDTPVHLTVYLLGDRMTFDAPDQGASSASDATAGAATGTGTDRAGDIALEEGTLVLLLLAAANHDPARFVEPDTLDILRADNGHVGFGFGIYHCLGAALARMEAQVAFPKLLAAFPTLRLDDEDVRYRASLAMHGLEELLVAW